MTPGSFASMPCVDDGTQHVELDPECWVEFNERFIDSESANRLVVELPGTCDFEQHSLSLFGRRVLEPRLTAWCGDVEYRYSGRCLPPRPWPDGVRALNQRLEQEHGLSFNHVLMNLYRDGSDSMGFHADDEPELGPDPTVASVSLGAPRRFVLRPKARVDRKCSREWSLGSGSLLIMGGSTQHRYQHAIPKTQRAVSGPRLSLTFRRVDSAPRNSG